MKRVTMQDVLDKKGKISKGVLPDLGTLPKSGKISKKEGVDELLQCLNPATFDILCVIRNIDFLINNTLNSFYLSCQLGQVSPDPMEPEVDVSSGACLSWWGLPGIAQAQKCINFDSPTRVFQACESKCNSLGKEVESSGCDGVTIFCRCE